MKKEDSIINEEIIGRRVTLTVHLLETLQAEANRTTNGNVSEMLRIILKKRYKIK